MTKLDSVLRSKGILLSTKVHIVKAMAFPVVMYSSESWTIKKDEGERINVFKLWYWRRLLRVSWTTMRSNQSILREISPEHSFQYSSFLNIGRIDAEVEAPILWPTDAKSQLNRKDPDAGKN